MSIFFLNSTNRLYNDTELNAVSKVLFSNGVFNSKEESHASWKISGDFLIEAAGSGMNVIAKPGMASVLLNVTRNSETIQERAIIKEDSQLSAEVASNPSIANRNDAVVLRIDQSVIDADELNEDGTNAVSLVVVSGNSATELTDAEISVALSGDPFIRLANILVPQSTIEITEQMITDARSLVEMSRSIKLASDALKLFGVETDPELPEQGDIWYNSTENALKLYDGSKTISLISSSTNWGYWNELNNADKFESIEENISEESVVNNEIYQIWNTDTDLKVTMMIGEVFEFPPITNPYIRVKLGNPTLQAGLKFAIYTVDVNDQPDTLVELLDLIGVSDLPKNDYVDLDFNQNYTAGTKYILIAISQLSIYTGSFTTSSKNQIQSSFNDDLTYLKGTLKGRLTTNYTENPLSLTWDADVNSDDHLIMSIQEKEDFGIGKTDIAGNANKIIQPFTTESKDIVTFYLKKGLSVGSPTGNINIKLYNADIDGNPIGSVLAQGEITQAEWESYAVNNDVPIQILYDKLDIGSKYCMVIYCEDESNTDYYTIKFGLFSSGTSLRYNTADGYVKLNGEISYKIFVSTIKKIVTTGDDGLINPELLKKRVQIIESSATPDYEIKGDTIVAIKALGANITDLSSGMIGVPYDFQTIEFRIKASGARTVAYGSMFEDRFDTLDTSIADGSTLRAVFEYDSVRGKFGCISSAVVA